MMKSPNGKFIVAWAMMSALYELNMPSELANTNQDPMNVIGGIIWNIKTHPKMIIIAHFSILSLVNVNDAKEQTIKTMSVELNPTNKEFNMSLLNVDSLDANNLIKYQ